MCRPEAAFPSPTERMSGCRMKEANITETQHQITFPVKFTGLELITGLKVTDSDFNFVVLRPHHAVFIFSDFVFSYKEKTNIA